MCQLETNNSAALAFIAVIIGKKYALPAETLSSVVDFYYRGSNRHNTLLWHDGLLRLARGYAAAMPAAEQVKLHKTASAHPHEGGITDEILRVIRQAGTRAGMGDGGSANVGVGTVII